AYSTKLGDVASELKAATIPVIDDLGKLGVRPDIIHGQHHLETMTAIVRFPDAPAVFFCHGWTPWEETPPSHPRIYRYVAVDHACRDRLMLENGVAEDRLRVLLNFVDLDRFHRRERLPERPRKALILSNTASERTHVPAVREACREAGIELDVMGLGVNRSTKSPETVLLSYDIVFAKGRTAIEALASGAAVILCDSSGVGPMVSDAEFGSLRSLNFGVRTLRDQLVKEALLREIARYDPADAEKVTDRIRATAGMDEVVDSIVKLYEEVLAEHESSPKRDRELEAQAVSVYLRWLAPLLKERLGLTRERDRLKSELAECRAALTMVGDEAVNVDRSIGGRALKLYGRFKRKFGSSANGA